jgi:hypothetical protein
MHGMGPITVIPPIPQAAPIIVKQRATAQ